VIIKLVKKKLHITSIGQSTHQDFVQKIGLRRILFDNFFGPRHIVFISIFLIILGCIWFEVSDSVYKFIDSEKDLREVFKTSASVDIIWVTRRDRDGGEQSMWIKQSLPQRYVWVGCQLNSDKALRLVCLKGHVRACDSTLWRYRWQEVREFLCTKIPLLEGVVQPIASKPRKCSLLPFSRFQNSRLTPRFGKH